LAKLSSVKIDPELADKGVWIPYREDIEFKIASLKSKAYSDFMRKAGRQRQKGFRKKDLRPDEVEPLMKKGLARFCLLDWKNIEDEDGTPIPYSAEQAEEWLSDPELVEMYEFVLECARDISLYQNEIKEDEKGNSEGSLSGT
jgi:hypothetical protein